MVVNNRLIFVVLGMSMAFIYLTKEQGSNPKIVSDLDQW